MNTYIHNNETFELVSVKLCNVLQLLLLLLDCGKVQLSGRTISAFELIVVKRNDRERVLSRECVQYPFVVESRPDCDNGVFLRIRVFKKRFHDLRILLSITHKKIKMKQP